MWLLPARAQTVYQIDVRGAHKEILRGHLDLGGTNPQGDSIGFTNYYMEVLKEMAIAAGMEVPLYTATGWGNAAIVQEGSIPVTAGYAYPTWAPLEPSPFYLFKDLHQNPDHAPVSYEPGLYPSFAAELGGGIQITYTRRPTIPPRSLEALIVRELGSGANGIGYYMYHGGSTLRGEGYYFADEAVGVPKINYDFQAPIGEYGQLRPSFHHLKLLHFFLDDYQTRLAPTVPVLPEMAAEMQPADVDELRYAVRAKDGQGFVFMLNYQDHLETHDLTDLQLQIQTEQGELRIPHASIFTLKSEESAILPFDLDLGGLHLTYATAQPLAVLDQDGAPHFAFTAIDGRLVADHFWHGQPWTIGLKRFFPEVARDGMYFYFRALYPDAPFLIDLPAEAIPDLQPWDARLSIGETRVVPEYQVILAF